MKQVKPVLKIEGEIKPDDELAMEIYINSDVDVKVKINVVSDESGDPLPDQAVVDVAYDLIRAVLATLSENVSDQIASESGEEGPQTSVSVYRSTE